MEKLVYLLEDDESIQELVKCTLSMSNITCECFSSIKEFKIALEGKIPDIVLLDIMLSDGSGLDTLTFLKKSHKDLYCIMLSALSKELDKVKGLNLGADDYITKPFSILELNAKLNAVYRRLKKKENIISLGNITIDTVSMQVTLNNEIVPLSSKEYKFLLYAIQNPNKVMTREELLTTIWGYESGESRTIDNYVAHLRKIGFVNIETVFGVGYKFKT